MKILMKVDQAAALRRGYDAPSSTEHVTVDPVELTEGERDALAEVLCDGHDATARGLAVDRYCRVAPMVATRPGLDGLREALAEMIAARDAARTALAAAREQVAAEMRDAYERQVGARETVRVRLRADGSLTEYYDALMSADVAVPTLPYVAGRSVTIAGGITSRVEAAEAIPGYAAAREAAEAARKAAIETALLELLRVTLAERESERAAREAAEAERVAAEAAARARREAAEAAEAAERDEYDALYARLSATLRARHADGLAVCEIMDSIRRLLRDDYGPAIRITGWGSREMRLETVTDDEYATLRAIRESAPEGAEVYPALIWDSGGTFRPARDDDPEAVDGDGDGDVWVPREGERRVAIVCWTRGGVAVAVAMPLS